MQENAPTFQVFPEQASTIAGQVDALYFYLVAVTVFFTVLIFGVILYFAIRYQRRSIDDRPPHVETSKLLEIVWSVIPLGLVTVMFFWGAQVFFTQKHIPPDAINVYVTGKQWMWKFQHVNGRREINNLHVPVGRAVKLTMGSEDVIHNVFIPAFRVKQDVMPGRYTTEWFQATKTGEFHLFCNQYCGTQHSNMVGKVIVMELPDYQAWLSGYTGETPQKQGERLFGQFACNTCHVDSSNARGPLLAGIFGKKVALEGGGVVVADDNYVRESILNPQAKIVAGFQPIMPSFQGLVNEEQLTSLIAYIQSLGATGPTVESSGAPSPGAPAASGLNPQMGTPSGATTVGENNAGGQPGPKMPIVEPSAKVPIQSPSATSQTTGSVTPHDGGSTATNTGWTFYTPYSTSETVSIASHDGGSTATVTTATSSQKEVH